ncbi:hypothetical protein AOLI_G00017580 [Acnodon oligacanthus]
MVRFSSNFRDRYDAIPIQPPTQPTKKPDREVVLTSFGPQCFPYRHIPIPLNRSTLQGEKRCCTCKTNKNPIEEVRIFRVFKVQKGAPLSPF